MTNETEDYYDALMAGSDAAARLKRAAQDFADRASPELAATSSNPPQQNLVTDSVLMVLQKIEECLQRICYAIEAIEEKGRWT